METFLPNLIEHLLNFLILFIIVYILLYKPVVKFMSDRAARVAAEQDEAQHALEDAQALRTQYEEKLENSHKEAALIFAQSEDHAKSERDKLIAEGRQRSEQIVLAARAQIDAERANALEQMRDDFASLAVQIASKVLEREVSVQDNAAVIDEFFEKVG